MNEETDEIQSFDDHDGDKRTHNKLLEAVNRLHKTQFIKKPIRSEPSYNRGEFNLVKTKSEVAIKQRPTIAAPHILARVLNKSKKLGTVAKELKNSLRNKKVLQKPLEKPELERINRTLSYQKTKKNLNQWNSVVTANRAADHLSFPLQKKTTQLKIYDSAHTDASKFRIKSELMVEMEKQEPEQTPNADNENDDENAKLTREEMIARNKELRLLRIRESQRSAKFRREKKIKSKKFHKILKKEKLKEQLKEFELMQKNDPEAAIRKLEEIEKRRVVERALLRHKNTGTWAKNLQVRAKYDKEARKELAEQLSVSRELTQTNRNLSDDEDDVENNVVENDGSEVINDNPWMGSSIQIDNESVNDNGYRKYWTQRNEDEEALKKYRSFNPIKQNVNGWLVEDCDKTENQLKSAETEDVLDDIFDEAEEVLQTKLSRKFDDIRNEISSTEIQKHEKKSKKITKFSLNDLSFKKNHQKPILDDQLNELQLDDDMNEGNLVKKISVKLNPSNGSMDDGNINPTEFVSTKKFKVDTTLPLVDSDSENEGAPNQLTIAEAFEDDDILNDFEKEAEDEREKNEPKDIDLTLPGWGSWGGCGIKRRPKKLILKFPKVQKRREENKGHVIIVDESNNRFRKHQVSNIPFPFTSVTDYEAAIRAPSGRDFVPELSHRLLTRREITTQLGTIIEPIGEDVKANK